MLTSTGLQFLGGRACGKRRSSRPGLLRARGNDGLDLFLVVPVEGQLFEEMNGSYLFVLMICFFRMRIIGPISSLLALNFHDTVNS